MRWYYAVGNQRQGPIEQTEFEQRVQAGVITADTLVWRQGMPQWQTLSQVLALDALAAGPLPLPPPPLEPVVAYSQHAAPGDTQATPNASTPEASAKTDAHTAPTVHEHGMEDAEYAGFWRRFLARFIDYMICSMVFQIIGGIFFAAQLSTFEEQTRKITVLTDLVDLFTTFSGLMVTMILVNMMLELAYECFFITRYAATPGKMVMGIKVFRADGSTLSLGRIVLRHLAYMLNGLTLGLGWIIAAFDPQSRALHDHLCDTRVVRV